jgi:hypothetical protein
VQKLLFVLYSASRVYDAEAFYICGAADLGNSLSAALRRETVTAGTAKKSHTEVKQFVKRTGPF